MGEMQRTAAGPGLTASAETMAEHHLPRGRRELEAVIEAVGAPGVRWASGGPRLEELDGGLVTPPGFDSDLIVRADLGFFYRFWLGHIE